MGGIGPGINPLPEDAPLPAGRTRQRANKFDDEFIIRQLERGFEALSRQADPSLPVGIVAEDLRRLLGGFEENKARVRRLVVDELRATAEVVQARARLQQVRGNILAELAGLRLGDVLTTHIDGEKRTFLLVDFAAAIGWCLVLAWHNGQMCWRREVVGFDNFYTFKLAGHDAQALKYYHSAEPDQLKRLFRSEIK